MDAWVRGFATKTPITAHSHSLSHTHTHTHTHTHGGNGKISKIAERNEPQAIEVAVARSCGGNQTDDSIETVDITMGPTQALAIAAPCCKTKKCGGGVGVVEDEQ